MEEKAPASRRIRVMLAEDNDDVIQRIADYLCTKPDIEIVAIERDGIGAKNAAILTRPDVLVLDLILANLDGFAIMQQLREMRITDIRIIVLSGLHSDFMIQRALQLGAYYYMIKPFQVELLYSHIVQSEPGARRMTEKLYESVDEEQAIVAMLNDVMGMSRRLKGTEYLLRAVMIARGLSNMGGRITKEIYPAVARLYGANSAQVERAIRHAIDRSWERGMLQDSGLFQSGKRPSNGEMIMTLAARKSANKIDI